MSSSWVVGLSCCHYDSTDVGNGHTSAQVDASRGSGAVQLGHLDHAGALAPDGDGDALAGRHRGEV